MIELIYVFSCLFVAFLSLSAPVYVCLLLAYFCICSVCPFTVVCSLRDTVALGWVKIKSVFGAQIGA